jgi:thymine-DNA glycosylase
MFVGVNPGIQTATTGFAYAHPSNRFYPLLHLSGITPQKCHPSEYRSLVQRYGLGHTNVVTRPTKDASMLSKKEMEDGVAAVEEKARQFRPGCVVMVGKSVWEAVLRVWKREGRWKSTKAFEYGWQDAWIGGDGNWKGSRVFAATSTSGLAASLSWEEKVRIWKQLGDWYRERVDTQNTTTSAQPQQLSEVIMQDDEANGNE